jgi:hypothetical protein
VPLRSIFHAYVRHWLSDMSAERGRAIDLYSVPAEVLDRLVAQGVTHIYLTGVWSVGPQAKQQARQHVGLRAEYDAALPGFGEDDIVGSPFAVASYHVAEEHGGDAGLAALRRRLAERNMGLLLDFIPNHVGLDHPWALQRPELLMPASSHADTSTFVVVDTAVGLQRLAHGRDPHFAPWTDTLQIDHRRASTRAALIDVLQRIAARCDGVRCDMAMLVLSRIFEQTWGHAALIPDHDRAHGEFWSDAIAAIRSSLPSFLFVAEAYWGTEDELVALGFDATYDKELYDRLIHGDAAGAVARVRSNIDHGRRVHFLENHDEKRVALTLPNVAQHQAAMAALRWMPGAWMRHHGQATGARRFARIQLRRRHAEATDDHVAAMYRRLDEAMAQCDVITPLEPVEVLAAWEGNHSHACLLAWHRPPTPERPALLALVNLAGHPVQGYLRCQDSERLMLSDWLLNDDLGHEQWQRRGTDLVTRGMYVDVAAYAVQLFRFTPQPMS